MVNECIEREISEILGLTHEIEAPTRPRKRGRRALEKQPTWALNFYEPTKNITYALISMCIKEDFEQTLEELAARVSRCKGRPKAECLKVLRELEAFGKLGYYDDFSLRFRTWRGGI